MSTYRIGQNVDQRECTAHHAKAQARNIRQYVLIFGDTNTVGYLLQTMLGLAQDFVDEKTKGLLQIKRIPINISIGLD